MKIVVDTIMIILFILFMVFLISGFMKQSQEKNRDKIDK